MTRLPVTRPALAFVAAFAFAGMAAAFAGCASAEGSASDDVADRSDARAAPPSDDPTHPLDGILRPNLDASDDASASTLAAQQSSCSASHTLGAKGESAGRDGVLLLAAGLAFGFRKRRKELYKLAE